jgi:hypothetical protein
MIRLSHGLCSLKIFGNLETSYNILRITEMLKFRRLLSMYDFIRIFFRFSLYIGMGRPLPIVIRPKNDAMFLKFENFLSFILLPFNENQCYNILYVSFKTGF